MSATAVAEWALTAGLLGGIGLTCVRWLTAAGRRGRLQVLALRRAPQGVRTAREAALEDPMFEPERIDAAVRRLLHRAETIWDADRPRPGQDLLGSWATSCAQVYGRPLRFHGTPRVDILRVVNRERDEEDEVVVRVRMTLQRGGPAAPGQRRMPRDERWTLSRDRDGWRLSGVGGDPLAAPLLHAAQIASPVDDATRLREDGVQELTRDRGHAGPPARDLIAADGPVAARLKDLALADDRYSPLLIETALTRIVDAWDQAGGGNRRPLHKLAGASAVSALVAPRRGSAVGEIRDVSLQHWEPLELDTTDDPAAVEVRVRIGGWGTARGDGVGDARHRRTVTLRWRLELGEDPRGRPRWRLVSSTEAST